MADARMRYDTPGSAQLIDLSDKPIVELSLYPHV